MSFIVRCWCSGCTGIDDQGCNDGRSWYLTNDDDTPKHFETMDEAESAGFEEVVDCGPWEYEVEEVSDEPDPD